MNEAAPPRVQPPPGMVALRLPLFDTPDRELLSALHPPWPRWMKRLYELEERSNEDIDASQGDVTASAALSALASRLKHRLDMLSFVTSVLEELGWEIELQDGVLIATARMRPYDARHALEAAGVAGPMSAVTELDSEGWPRLWYGGDA